MGKEERGGLRLTSVSAGRQLFGNIEQLDGSAALTNRDGGGAERCVPFPSCPGSEARALPQALNLKRIADALN